MDLQHLFEALADAFDGPGAIEQDARHALRAAGHETPQAFDPKPLPAPLVAAMAREDAHPVCKVIARTPLPWAPPRTSSDPLYVAHSLPKVNVELLGPDGLVTSQALRIGLYGMLPGFEYGIRTHPAEEVFLMLAGAAQWKRDTARYLTLAPGQRSHHPSMMPHATRTTDTAFLSAWVWRGDISTDDYVYAGIPAV